MGSRHDHIAKFEHIRSDIDAHQDHLGMVKDTSRLSQDFLFCAYNLLDYYLDYLGSHPENAANRERVFRELRRHSKPFDIIFEEYHSIRNYVYRLRLLKSIPLKDFTHLTGLVDSMRQDMQQIIPMGLDADPAI